MPGDAECSPLDRQERAEVSKERINLQDGADALYERPRQSRQHWSTDILDFDDFAIVQPVRARLFRKLSKLQNHFERAGRTLSKEEMDEEAVKVLGCRLEDLCLAMEFVPQSEAKEGVSETTSAMA